MIRKLELYIDSEQLEQLQNILSLDEHDLDDDDDCLSIIETVIEMFINE